MRLIDLLRFRPLERFVKWRYSRLVLQIPLLLVALLALYDGFYGRQLAPKNFATVSVWLHYRGFLVLAIAIVGNLFCAACPMLLVRGPTRFVKRYLPEFQWPRALRNKYFVIALTLFYLFAYEYWDLWASPWLTAWLIVGYFVAAFVVDALFPEGTFCKYVCPLGNFNFTLSTVSPTQITARDPKVCLTCEGHYCVNGRVETPEGRKTLREAPDAKGLRYPGCETKLYVPQIDSNMDCTLCMNCVRACPHDNVAWKLRAPMIEAAWARYKTDVVWLGVLLFFAGFMNALAMVPPYYQIAEKLSRLLGTRNEAILLSTIYLLWTGLGLTLTIGVAVLADRISGVRASPAKAVRYWGTGFFPLAFAMWAGHYTFHFLTGWASIIPVTQQALNNLGIYVGEPDWTLAALVPENWLYPLQVTILYIGLLAASYVLFRRARKRNSFAAGAVVFLYFFLLVALALWVLAQPMEMRGTLLLPQ